LFGENVRTLDYMDSMLTVKETADLLHIHTNTLMVIPVPGFDFFPSELKGGLVLGCTSGCVIYII
jgi:hypothetical protein